MSKRRAGAASICACMLAGLGLVAGASGCSEEEDDVLGFALVEDVVEATGPFRVDLDVSDLDTYFQTTRQSSDRVWVGLEPSRTGPVEAKTLMRFDITLPAGSVVIADTLRLGCDASGDYGEDTPTGISIERVTAGSWYENASTGWPFDEHDASSPLGSVTVDECTFDPETGDGITATAQLPADVLDSWAANPEDNHGIALVFVGGTGFKRFNLERTTLNLRYAVDSDTTLVRAQMTHHATLYSLDPEIEAGGTGGEPYALVGSPYDYRGIVRFSLATLPDGANVQRMSMRLRLDPDQTQVAAAIDTVVVGLHRVVSIPGEILDPRPAVTFFAEPTALHAVAVARDTALIVDVSAFGRAIEDGILIKHNEGYPPLSQFGFYTREATPELRPRLEVVFTLPATIRL